MGWKINKSRICCLPYLRKTSLNLFEQVDSRPNVYKTNKHFIIFNIVSSDSLLYTHGNISNVTLIAVFMLLIFDKITNKILCTHLS